MPLLRVEKMTRHINPHAAIFLGKVIGQEAIGHQMEAIEVHRVTSYISLDGADSLTYDTASTLPKRGCIVNGQTAARASVSMLSRFADQHHWRARNTASI